MFDRVLNTPLSLGLKVLTLLCNVKKYYEDLFNRMTVFATLFCNIVGENEMLGIFSVVYLGQSIQEWTKSNL